MSSVAIPEQETPAPATELSTQWARHVKLLGITWAAMIMLFWRDAASMVQTWWDISTYNHCLLILPIIYWLVHQRQEELAKITPQFWRAGLLWIAIAAFGWMLGEAAGVAFARQLGLVMMERGELDDAAEAIASAMALIIALSLFVASESWF